MRVCANPDCDRPIDAHRRIDARYCDASCRSAARHARTASSAPEREVGRQAPPSVERRQRRASEPTAPDPEYYTPPPEWAWLATYYATHRASGSAT